MRKILVLICIILLGLSPAAFSAQAKRIARIVDIKGSVQVKQYGKNNWMRASKDMVLNEGDTLKTQSFSEATVKIEGKKGEEDDVIEVSQNTQLVFAELKHDEEKGIISTLLDLFLGGITATSRKSDKLKSNFEVKTPTSVIKAGEQDTSFRVDVEKEE